MSWYAAQASNRGGTTVFRRAALFCKTAYLISVGVALGNADHKRAIVPVTKGAAALVPPNVSDWPSEPRLVISSPGALSPRLPAELARFE
jgi:hypothetical protein